MSSGDQKYLARRLLGAETDWPSVSAEKDEDRIFRPLGHILATRNEGLQKALESEMSSDDFEAFKALCQALITLKTNDRVDREALQGGEAVLGRVIEKLAAKEKEAEETLSDTIAEVTAAQGGSREPTPADPLDKIGHPRRRIERCEFVLGYYRETRMLVERLRDGLQEINQSLADTASRPRVRD